MRQALRALDGESPLRRGEAERSRAEVRLLARSSWHETRPIGGPAGQGAFLNGAATIATELAPADLVQYLLAIERSAGRERHQRWDARPLDLDLLVYGETVVDEPDLRAPHPRMHGRRFVLDPAAEIAAAMRDPESGWTVGALARHLHQGSRRIGVADVSAPRAARLAELLRQRFSGPIDLVGGCGAALWETEGVDRPRLVLACDRLSAEGDAFFCAGLSPVERRRMLGLPPLGPVVWLDPDWERMVVEAAAAVESSGL